MSGWGEPDALVASRPRKRKRAHRQCPDGSGKTVCQHCSAAKLSALVNKDMTVSQVVSILFRRLRQENHIEHSSDDSHEREKAKSELQMATTVLAELLPQHYATNTYKPSLAWETSPNALPDVNQMTEILNCSADKRNLVQYIAATAVEGVLASRRHRDRSRLHGELDCLSRWCFQDSISAEPLGILSAVAEAAWKITVHFLNTDTKDEIESFRTVTKSHSAGSVLIAILSYISGSSLKHAIGITAKLGMLQCSRKLVAKSWALGIAIHCTKMNTERLSKLANVVRNSLIGGFEERDTIDLRLFTSTYCMFLYQCVKSDEQLDIEELQCLRQYFVEYLQSPNVRYDAINPEWLNCLCHSNRAQILNLLKQQTVPDSHNSTVHDLIAEKWTCQLPCVTKLASYAKYTFAHTRMRFVITDGKLNTETCATQTAPEEGTIEDVPDNRQAEKQKRTTPHNRCTPPRIFRQLPFDIVSHLIEFLDIVSSIHLNFSSKWWLEIMRPLEQRRWKKYFQLRFGVLECIHRESFKHNWKLLFKRRVVATANLSRIPLGVDLSRYHRKSHKMLCNICGCHSKTSVSGLARHRLKVHGLTK